MCSFLPCRLISTCAGVYDFDAFSQETEHRILRDKRSGSLGLPSGRTCEFGKVAADRSDESGIDKTRGPSTQVVPGVRGRTGGRGNRLGIAGPLVGGNLEHIGRSAR